MKKTRIFFSLLIALSICLVALAPTLVSTNYGKSLLLSYLSNHFSADFKAENISLSWFGPQKFQNISMENPTQQIYLTCDHYTQKENLFSILFKGITPPLAIVDNLNLKADKIPRSWPSFIKELIGNQLSVNLQSYPEETINRLVADIKSPQMVAHFNGSFDWDNQSIELPGELKMLTLQNYRIENLKLLLAKTKASQLALGLSGIFLHTNEDLKKIFGEDISINATANLNLKRETDLQPLRVSLEGKKASLKFSGELERNSLRLTEDTLFTYRLPDITNGDVSYITAIISPPLEPINVNVADNFAATGKVLWSIESNYLNSIYQANFEMTVLKMPMKGENEHEVSFKAYNNDGFLEMLAKIDARFLTLKRPLTAELNVNPLLQKPQIISRLTFLNEIESFEAPLRMKVASHGFVLPLNLDLYGLQIEQMEVYLGNIILKNRNQLRRIADYFAFKRNGPLLVKFSPAFLSVKAGVANLQRIDLLVGNKIPLFTWGKINLINEMIDMKLAVPSNALSSLFNMSFLERNETIVFPLAGTIQQPKIDTSKLEMKLTNLAAKALGGAVEGLTGSKIPANEEEVPAPTSTIPWGHLLPQNSKKENKNGKPSKKVFPIDSIQKGAKQLLKKALDM